MSKFAERTTAVVAFTLILTSLAICARPLIDWMPATDPRWGVWTGVLSAAATILGSSATLATVVVMLRQIREDNRRAEEIRHLEEQSARRESRRELAVAEGRALIAAIASVIHMTSTLERAGELIWPDKGQAIRPDMQIQQLESISTAFDTLVQMPIPYEHMAEMVRLATNCRSIAGVMRSTNFANADGKEHYIKFTKELEQMLVSMKASSDRLQKVIAEADA